MAHSDDPPFLNVGTEVSAKYRGAFCEATIKVAKKLVKCKVSYSKGQTAVVNHDLIRGSLKANAQVEVKQADGLYQPATVIRLMDNTTYTVVFDDGDERTLRRSSLCLKGARHFDESETLNHLPLTDPENFGTPVQMKIGRKRHRNSLGPTAEDDGSVKKVKSSSYPTEFPVGKTVFLENDRRRSSWLPAVVVPVHYLEESELTTDKLCIRSFKDGRFYAVPKEDLHDFAPDKEPLLSMLEGEIQAMYLDKPSIERAMAYLDTGELPWDMDLFDKSNNISSSPDVPIHEEEEPEGVELLAKREEFKNKLKTYYDSKGISYPDQPMLGSSPLDIYKLYALIKDNGGMDRVTQEMKWVSISLQMGFTSEAASAAAIRMAYKKFLYAFEMFEKGKGKARDTPLRRKSGHTNMASETAGESEEDGEERQTPKGEEKQPSKGEEKQAPPTVAKVTRKLLKENSKSSLPPERGSTCEKLGKVERSSEAEKTAPAEKACGEMVSEGSTPKTEKRVAELDQDDWQLESSSSNGDDTEERHIPVPMDGVEPSKTGYEEGNRVLVWYGKGKQQLTYEAKIIGVDKVVETDHKEYLVHYSGWNTRYDEWVDESRIAGKVSSPSSSMSKGSTRLNQKPKVPTPASGGNGRKAKNKDINTADSPQAEKKESIVAKDTAATPPHVSAAVNLSPVTPVTTPPVPLSTPSLSTTTPSLPASAGGTPNAASGKPAKGRGGGRRRKISSSLESSDCSMSPLTSAVLTLSSTRTHSASPPAVSVEDGADPTASRLASRTVETKPAATMETAAVETVTMEGLQGGDGGLCIEQSEGPKEEGSHVLCGSVESSSDDVSKEKVANGSPPELPVVEEKLKEGLLKEKVEDKDVEGGEGSEDDVKKVKEDGEEEIEAEEKEEGQQLKLVDDEVFNDDQGEAEEEVEGKMEQERNSSNSSAHPDPVGSSPHTSDTNSPDDPDPPLSPNKQECPEDNSCKLNSEKGVSPTQPPSTKRASSTPERKRRWRDLTVEEYEERMKARREELNFTIDTSSLMQMTNSERIQVIQERIKDLQKRWQDLKAEVTYLDRRKRTARRKEKEARSSNYQGSPSHLISTSS